MFCTLADLLSMVASNIHVKVFLNGVEIFNGNACGCYSKLERVRKKLVLPPILLFFAK